MFVCLLSFSTNSISSIIINNKTKKTKKKKLKIKKQDGSFLRFATETAEANNKKPYCVIVPNKKPIIRITTHEAAKHILKDNFTNYIKIDSEATRLLGKEFFGERGIFVLDGEAWRFERLFFFIIFVIVIIIILLFY